MGKTKSVQTQQGKNSRKISKSIQKVTKNKASRQSKRKLNTDDIISEISTSLQELQQQFQREPPQESVSELITISVRRQLDQKQIIRDESIDHTKIIQWAYKQSKVCEKCNKWQSEESLMFCIACEDAYHTYCIKSKKNPGPNWLCPNCKLQSKEKEKQKLQKQTILPVTSVKKPNSCKKCSQILSDDQNVKKCMNCSQKFHSNCFKSPKKQDISLLCLFCDKNLTKVLQNTLLTQFFKPKVVHQSTSTNSATFLLTKNTVDDSTLVECKKSLLLALETQQIIFTDDLVYDQVERTFNNPQLEPLLSKLPKGDSNLFKKFKELTRRADYGPFQVFHDELQGYVVKALQRIPQRTLICEYTGQVKKFKEVVFSNNDSIMTLLQTGRAETTLVIVPEKYGNLAKYLSGINNFDSKLKQKQNVASIRYDIEGEVRVLLYASKTIQTGEILYYDYNAGGLNSYNTQDFV